MANSSDSKRLSDANTIRYVNLYESEDKIYIRKISGFYQSIRRYTGAPLLLSFLLLPWLVIDGRPAVYFDLPQRHFYILWATFGPQDGMLLGWLLIISAFALFSVTALLGRVWCGFTCPQTVWTLMFVWSEHLCEGDRNKRMKLDQSPWTLKKSLQKSSKYLLWFVIAFITGLTFVGYFHPIRDLLSGFWPVLTTSGTLSFNANASAVFWTFFFTGITYMNAGFLREQVCKYMCPYARFQSVMYDMDTLAVHYDKVRGEPRGVRKPQENDQENDQEDDKRSGKGDCVDCSWCVQVCPVDIDIRDGMQYECINCGLCVDACNAVMDKVGYERGLIRFTSEDQLANGKTRFMRPRVFSYLGLLILMIGIFAYTLAEREPITLDIDRDRGARMFRLQGDKVQNVYMIKVHNMDRQTHTFHLHLESTYPFIIKRYRPLPVDANEIFSFPVRIEIDRSQLKNIKTDLTFVIQSIDKESIMATETTTFIGPE